MSKLTVSNRNNYAVYVHMKTINWGVIGTGDVMEVKSGPGLSKAEGSQLYGVFNRSHDKAIDYAKRHGISRVFASADELIESSHIDVVYIATPPVSHRDYAIAALHADKIPYIEKPLTMTYAEALDIQTIAKKKQLPVYVAFYRRGLEKFLTIKQLIEDGVLGTIRYATITQTAPITCNYSANSNLPWRVIPEISGGGLFMDIGSHVLDSLMLLFGEFDHMSGQALNVGGYYTAEDTVCACFQFKNGVVGTGQWCFVADEFTNMVEIVGDKGRIEYDGLSAKRFTLTLNGEPKIFEFEQPQHIAMPYQQAVVNELLGKGKSQASFDHAVNLMKMMDGVLAPYYNRN